MHIPISDNTTADMTFYSMRDETVIENPEENDSKFTDNSTIEDTHMVDVSKPLKTTSSSQGFNLFLLYSYII